MPTIREVEVPKDAKMMPTAKSIQIPTKESSVVYINKKALDSCIDKVGEIEKVTFQCEKLIGELTQAVIDELEYPDNLKQNQKDDDTMVPIDIHPSYAAFGNVEQMVQHIGVHATVEAFIEGHTYVQENKHKLARFYDTRPASATKLLAELAKKKSKADNAEVYLNAAHEEEDKSDGEDAEPLCKKAKRTEANFWNG